MFKSFDEVAGNIKEYLINSKSQGFSNGSLKDNEYRIGDNFEFVVRREEYVIEEGWADSKFSIFLKSDDKKHKYDIYNSQELLENIFNIVLSTEAIADKMKSLDCNDEKNIKIIKDKMFRDIEEAMQGNEFSLQDLITEEEFDTYKTKMLKLAQTERDNAETSIDGTL